MCGLKNYNSHDATIVKFKVHHYSKNRVVPGWTLMIAGNNNNNNINRTGVIEQFGFILSENCERELRMALS